MNRVFIDTNIIIDYSNGFEKDLKTIFVLQKQKKLQIFINPIVIEEFYTDKRLKKPENLRRAKKLFQIFSVINIFAKDGLLAAEILRANEVYLLSDALIAATCINNNFELATRNIKDFKHVKKLKLFTF